MIRAIKSAQMILKKLLYSCPTEISKHISKHNLLGSENNLCIKLNVPFILSNSILFHTSMWHWHTDIARIKDFLWESIKGLWHPIMYTREKGCLLKAIVKYLRYVSGLTNSFVSFSSSSYLIRIVIPFSRCVIKRITSSLKKKKSLRIYIHLCCIRIYFIIFLLTFLLLYDLQISFHWMRMKR